MKLKEARLGKGLGRGKLAERAGVTPPDLLRYEHAQKPPKLERALRIARALGVDPASIDEFRPALENAGLGDGVRLYSDEEFKAAVEREVERRMAAQKEDVIS